MYIYIYIFWPLLQPLVAGNACRVFLFISIIRRVGRVRRRKSKGRRSRKNGNCKAICFPIKYKECRKKYFQIVFFNGCLGYPALDARPP